MMTFVERWAIFTGSSGAQETVDIYVHEIYVHEMSVSKPMMLNQSLWVNMFNKDRCCSKDSKEHGFKKELIFH